MSNNIVKGPEPHLVPDVTLGQFFFESAKQFGGRTCQIDAIADQHESFSSVRRRSTRVAIAMQKRGIVSEDVIAICSPTFLDTAIPILATFYLGAKIANLDSTLSVRQVTHLLSLVSPKIIFVDESCLNLIETSLSNANLPTEIVVFGKSSKHRTFSDFDTFQPNEEEFSPIVVDLNETAVILFSSGTTGLPKAICHSNYSFLHLAHFFYYSTVKLEVILAFSSFYWITAMLFLTCSFIGGGHRIICGNTVDPERTFRVIEKYKVTFVFLAPILTHQLTNFKKQEDYDISSVYVLLTSGTPLSTKQICKLQIIFKEAYIIDGYGQSENGFCTIFNPLTDEEFIRSKNESCGKVMTGYTLKIVDPESDKILGPNQPGEVLVKSNSAMKGYYKSDSSEMLYEEGFLRTGDIGYFDNDECLFIVGRSKEMFKYLSWHIVPSAIEEVLLEHPAIEEAVVFGFPRNEDEGEVPAACIVVKEKVSEKEIEEFVAVRVSDREKLRGGVFFVSEIPKTPSGKVRRKEIKDSIINSEK